MTNGPTYVGKYGVGQLTISNSTMQTRDVTISSQLGSLGTLTLMSGTLMTSNLFNGTNGVINGVGTISGPVTSAGTISPGFSPGRIFTTSNLTLQATSTVSMELGGTDTNLYDQIFVGNNLQVDGTLDVSLINAFDPALNNTFHLFDFAFLRRRFRGDQPACAGSGSCLGHHRPHVGWRHQCGWCGDT